MKLAHNFAVTLLAGVAVGGAIVQGLHAQARPPAYVINEIDISDTEGFKTYADRMSPIITSMGGKFLIRGGVTEALDGEPPKRITVYVFDSMAKMQAWHDAPAVQALKPLRDKAAKFRAFAVEGVAH